MSFIELIKYLFLGIVQGITEVLPISSSGHVELFKALLGIEMDENLIFLILLNTGSLLAFIIIYFKKLLELGSSFLVYIFKPSLREKNYQNYIFFSKILVASIPAGIFGLLMSDLIDSAMATYDILLAGVGLLVTGTVIYFVSKVHLKRGSTYLNWYDVLFIGLAQAVAIFPGISRSGMTTSTALKRGLGIDTALNFSFLMYIPISLASLLFMITDVGSSDFSALSVEILIYYLFAFVGAVFATMIAYKLIFNIFRSGRIRYFSYYCFAVGLLAVVLYLI
jgi:undecaprenyl-diphosphatase